MLSCPQYVNRPVHAFFFLTVDIDKLGKLICWKLINEDIVHQSFEILLTFANLVPRALFSGLCPPPKPAKSALGTRLNVCKWWGAQIFTNLRGYIFAHLRRIPFKIGKFTNIKALLQVVSVDFPFTWSRSTGPGRVSTLSVPGFHMQGHCNTRKIYTF